jgi:hypothetical protein
MSAAAEYYGYLLSQGYGEEQIAKFAYFADQANKGIISQNKAFRLASKEGWSNGDGKFKDWVNKANDEGWIDKGLEIFGAMKAGGMFQRKDRRGGGGYYAPPPPPPPKNNTMLYVIGGVAVIGIGIAIYFATKKK